MYSRQILLEQQHSAAIYTFQIIGNVGLGINKMNWRVSIQLIQTYALCYMVLF